MFLWWPDAKRLGALGYDSVAHVPVLFDSDWRYHNELNRYLRERALLEWSPSDVKAPRHRFVSGNKYPTKRTLENIGRELANYFGWLEWRKLDWTRVSYARHLVQGYQNDLQSGRWSLRGNPLAPSTVNIYLNSACAFQAWAAERGLREKFAVASAARLVRADSGTRADGDKPLVRSSRAGAVRKNPKTLRIPTTEEHATWLSQVEIYHGRSKGLCCELITETAIRLQEAIQWRIDTLPLERDRWQVVGDNVEVEVRFGAKGPKPTPDSLEGPPRLISLPLAMAEKLDEYRRVYRPLALGRWVRSGGTLRDAQARLRMVKPKQLFLSDYTGQPFGSKALYSSWKKVPSLPFAAWSPHLGRHFWACRTLLKSQLARAALMGRSLESMPTDWITSQATTDIQLLIQPQLGHVNQETTLMYLTWVQRAVTLAHWTDHYHASLESDG